MMKATIITLLVALVAVVAVAGQSHIIKEEIKGAPLGWTKLERADPSQPIDITILVKQQNVDQLIDIFERVSNPKSSDYGQYLTNDEVNELVAPKEQHIAAVMQWLHYNKIKTTESIAMTPNRDMIHISMTVGEAESLLQTHYHEYSHASGLTQVVRAERYSIPAYLVDAIDVIGPTVRFPSQSTVLHSKKRDIVSPPMHTLKAAKLKKMKKSNPIQDACSQGTTPDCLKQLYSVNGYTATSPNTSLATTGYLEQYISPSDLAQFFQSYDPTHARTATIIGPNDPTNPGVEASLDIQYTMGVAQGVPTQFWYTAGRQPLNPDNEPFLVFLLNLSSTADAPWVISTSYGDDEHTVDYSYAVRVNQEFAKAAVRGISILFSSGDGGVSGGQSQPCTTFIPTYPAGSPFVTSVGGTTGFNPESGVYFSSGGFSNYWPRADMAKYQLKAVEDYFTTYSKNMPPPNLYNSSGRGFPDVSAQGTSYPVVVGGSMQPVDGTSCSTPTFSAIVSLLNDIRFAAGKPPLGFLNNLFYQNPQMFTDITTGSNPGCNTNGFTASQGWDPITGLGTPNFAAMANVVKNLP